MLRFWRAALLPALLLLSLAPAVPHASAGRGCAVDLESRNRWWPAWEGGPAAMDDHDPCRMLMASSKGVFASDDGGLSFSVVSSAPPTEPARLIASGLPSGHALLVGKDGSLWRTADRGRGWARAEGLGGAVRDVSADEQRAGHLLAVVSPKPVLPALPLDPPAPAGSALYESTDEGRSFTAVAGASGLPATAALLDAGQPSRWWLGTGGPAGALLVSEDAGTTFTPVSAGAVTGLASSRLAGGGSELMAATSDGLRVTRDGGQSVAQHLKGTPLAGVALEWQHPSAAMLLTTSVLRTSNTGVTSRPQAAGLPASCNPSDLRRDRSIPSVFLVSCADGSTWRYRSDGTDLTATDMPDGSGAGLAPPLAAPVPVKMRELGRWKLPEPGTRRDGSIASDGTVLFYADKGQKGVVHRMVARTGKPLPDLRTGMKHAVGHLAYDANRDQLLMLDSALVVWELPLRNGRLRKLFHAPLSGYSEEDDEQSSNDNGTLFYGAMSYDSATDHLLFANDGSDSFVEYDRAGHQQRECASLGLANVVPVRLGGGTYESSIAGLVATGDGLVYVEAEDDSTVVRIDRSCRVLATFQHEYFSEAPEENDGIACDTTTFDEPAIWLRDAVEARVVAYSVEAGYCALPASVSVKAPAGVATGESGRVCSRLWLTAKGRPLAGQRVDLLVAGRGIGSPVTDRQGRACATYRPLPREAGAGTGTASARQPVLAAFLGTPAFRPASARASLVVSRQAPPAPPPPRAPAPVVEALPPVPPPPPPQVAPPAQPPAQPPQPPPPAGQHQPVLQGHPGAQPGAMGQAAGALAPEDEVEAAAEGGDTHLAVAVEWEAYALPPVVGVVVFAAVLKRRRASRVRSQSA
jgi:hypothetical protein